MVPGLRFPAAAGRGGDADATDHEEDYKEDERDEPSRCAPNAARRMPRAQSIDEYLAALPEDQRRALGKLRSQIKAAAPRATEGISYGLPTFNLDGRPLAYFGAWANHYSLYGLPTEAMRADLAGLKNCYTSKGTIHFPVDKPLPSSLVTALVRARIVNLKKAAKS